MKAAARFILCFHACFASVASADEVTAHRFDPQGIHKSAGFPEKDSPQILAAAGKPLALNFTGLPAGWNPIVHIHRVTAARRIALPSAGAEFTSDIWRVSWTPPEARGPAHYEIRLEGESERTVRIETRDATWIEATREAFADAEWETQGLTAGECSALATLGLRLKPEKSSPAFMEMRPRDGAASRRRIVWDGENHHLLVWRPGPAAGDLEVRAPRWWISPEALATDHGLIRFLDLFSEPPPNP